MKFFHLEWLQETTFVLEKYSSRVMRNLFIPRLINHLREQEDIQIFALGQHPS